MDMELAIRNGINEAEEHYPQNENGFLWATINQHYGPKV